MAHIKPGTYRVMNVASGTALAIPENNVWDVVGWERNDNKNQQWFAQRSGEGYRFKNSEYGHYLAISNTCVQAPLYAGRYPTSWQLIQNQEDHNMYILKCGDVDLVIDLDDYGAGHNGNHIHAYAQEHWVPQKRWRLERLSDETGDDEWRLTKEVAEKNEQLVSKDQQLTTKIDELASKERHIIEMDKQTAELSEQLASKDEELAHVRQELVEKSALLEQSRRNLEDKALQQQKENAGLHEKIERVERLLAQTMDSGNKRPNNMN